MDIKSEIYNLWLEASHKIVDRAAERLAEITPDDPAHWAPNIKSGTVGSVSITFEKMIDAHFVADKRKRPRIRERLVRDLLKQKSYQALIEKMVDRGFLVKK